MLEKV
jgi:hypothetical protein